MITRNVQSAGRSEIRILLFIAALFVNLSAGPAVHAWVTDDVYDRVTEAINRINTANGNASNAFTRAREAAISTEGLRDVIDRIGVVYEQVDGPGKDLIDSYVQMLIELIEHQQAGFQDFVTPDETTGITPAGDFRDEIKALLGNMESITNDLIDIDDLLDLSLDVSVINQLVDIVPDLLLYPISVLMNQGLNLMDSGLPELLEQVATDLKDVKQILADYSAPAGVAGLSPQEPTYGASSWGEPTVRTLAYTLQAKGNIIKLAGNLGMALTDGDAKEAKLGIHGYVAIHGEVKPFRVVASLMSVIGEAIGLLAARLENIADYIGANRSSEEIHGKLDQIIAALQATAPDTFHSSTSVPLAAYPLASVERQIRVDSGERISLSAGVVTSPNASYQWLKDGEAIPGAVLANYTIGQTTASDAGQYSVMVTDDSGSTTSAAASLSLIPGRVMNMSVRFDIPDNGTLIAGFVLEEEKRVVVRGIGQSLAEFGIPIESTMQDPTIAIYDASGTVVASNDDYVGDVESDSAMADVGAFPIVSPKDAAIYTLLPSGAYTVHIAGHQLKGGDCIVEVYDADNL